MDSLAATQFRQLLADESSTGNDRRRFTCTLGTKNGEHIPADLAVCRAACCGAEWVLVMARDITERHRLEAALRESEAQFREITERSLAIIVIHQDRRIVYSNPQILPVLGYRPDEMLGRDPMDFVHPDDRPEATAWANARQAGLEVPERHEWRFLAKDGHLVWADVLASRATFRSGKAVLAIAVDITERKRAEEQARKHQADLAHVTRLGTMGEMAAGLAHELNQPLGAIANYAGACVEMIRAGKGDREMLLASMEQVCSEAVRAGDIIRQLRKFVRKGEPRRTTVDVNELVREVVRFMEAEARHNAVSLQVELADGMPATRADNVQIKQVILNLVRNAFEAIEDGLPERRRVAIQTAVNKDSVAEVAVRDWGRGLSEDVRDRIFDAFFTTKPDGLGMGLSISRSIVEAHGGRLWAAPDPDGGTVIRFTLPITPPNTVIDPKDPARDY